MQQILSSMQQAVRGWEAQLDVVLTANERKAVYPTEDHEAMARALGV